MNKFRVYIVTALLTVLVSVAPAFSNDPAKNSETEPQKPMLSKTIADSMRNGHIYRISFQNYSFFYAFQKLLVHLFYHSGFKM